MQDVRYLRSRAAMCLDLARHISNDAEARHLRVMADAYRMSADRAEAGRSDPIQPGEGINKFQEKH
jgi:hypothetical protein